MTAATSGNTASKPRGSAAAPHPTLPRYFNDESERLAYVRKAFNESAPHYDTINNVMSFGTNNRYRREALERAGVKEGMKVLDVGCGTGVVAWHAERMVGAKGMVVGVDPSIGMLTEAIKRERVRLPVNGMGERLPIADETFDFLSMSYALRHVADLVETFKEYRRVLKPGGKLLILEMTPPARGVSFYVLKFYMRYIVPLITRFGTVSKEAQVLYNYCWDTFETCVPPDDIMNAMREAGFTDVSRHVELRIFSEYSALK